MRCKANVEYESQHQLQKPMSTMKANKRCKANIDQAKFQEKRRQGRQSQRKRFFFIALLIMTLLHITFSFKLALPIFFFLLD